MKGISRSYCQWEERSQIEEICVEVRKVESCTSQAAVVHDFFAICLPMLAMEHLFIILYYRFTTPNSSLVHRYNNTAYIHEMQEEPSLARRRSRTFLPRPALYRSVTPIEALFIIIIIILNYCLDLPILADP